MAAVGNLMSTRKKCPKIRTMPRQRAVKTKQTSYLTYQAYNAMTITVLFAVVFMLTFAVKYNPEIPMLTPII